MPSFWQCFISDEAGATGIDLDRKLFVVRKRIEHDLPAEQKTYFPSLSARTLIYKGMFTTPQLGGDNWHVEETYGAMQTARRLIAEVLEELAVARGRHAIRDLLAYLPAAAIVRRGGETEEVPLEDVLAGRDRVRGVRGRGGDCLCGQ